ncbi:hypothetical protein AYO21_02067 [Fonsecaea monophora]|uniref:Uncharacterized protein n=1 Tax=Fonsecaea monophora TaxID=254056 RepID=A0A177FJN2_9EURO|nr:hypothetical protein AYO21_02067 [Fonsecaea monophora]OAG43840.1 hypothetical protein AYO21_02067 [Fonsecaea monophora]
MPQKTKASRSWMADETVANQECDNTTDTGANPLVTDGECFTARDTTSGDTLEPVEPGERDGTACAQVNITSDPSRQSPARDAPPSVRSLFNADALRTAISKGIDEAFSEGEPRNAPPITKKQQKKRKAATNQGMEDEPGTSKKSKTIEDKGKGALRGRAKKIHEHSTALEISKITEELQKKGKDVARELGIFLEGDQVVLKVAGLTIPASDAPQSEKRRFDAALSSAIMVTENKHMTESWWQWTSQQVEKTLGIRQLDEGETAVDIQQLLDGTRRRDSSQYSAEESDSQVEDGQKSRGGGQVARKYLESMNMLGSQRRNPTPRGSKVTMTTNSLIREGLALQDQKKARIPDSVRYPTLPSNHPNWSKVVTKAELYTFIKEYPFQKTTRHELLPKYFGNRGNIYLKGPGLDLVKEWVARLEEIGKGEFPKDMIPIEVMVGLLARYNETVARLSTHGMINSEGRIRKKALPKLEENRDPTTGKFLKTGPGDGDVRPLNELGAREGVVLVLQNNYTTQNRKTQERTDVTRSALQSGTLELAKNRHIQDQKMDAMLKAFNAQLSTIKAHPDTDTSALARQIEELRAIVRDQTSELYSLKKEYLEEKKKREQRDEMLLTLHNMLIGDTRDFLMGSAGRDAEEMSGAYAEISKLWLGVSHHGMGEHSQPSQTALKVSKAKGSPRRIKEEIVDNDDTDSLSSEGEEANSPATRLQQMILARNLLEQADDESSEGDAS